MGFGQPTYTNQPAKSTANGRLDRANPQVSYVDNAIVHLIPF
jgi:hypothetical protein